jgi:fatty acid desaturase
VAGRDPGRSGARRAHPLARLDQYLGGGSAYLPAACPRLKLTPLGLVYGLASLTLFIATLRAIAEHQVGGDHHGTSGDAALRNLQCGPIERLIFGCYGFAEHATHQRNPAIPSYHLAEATRELAIGDATLIPELSYGEILTLHALVDDLPDERPTTRGHAAK